MDRVDDDGNINDDDGPYSGSTITPPTPSKHTMATTLFDDLNCVVSIEPIHVLEKEDDEGGDDGRSDSIVESGQKRHRRNNNDDDGDDDDKEDHDIIQRGQYLQQQGNPAFFAGSINKSAHNGDITHCDSVNGGAMGADCGRKQINSDPSLCTFQAAFVQEDTLLLFNNRLDDGVKKIEYCDATIDVRESKRKALLFRFGHRFVFQVNDSAIVGIKYEPGIDIEDDSIVENEGGVDQMSSKSPLSKRRKLDSGRSSLTAENGSHEEMTTRRQLPPCVLISFNTCSFRIFTLDKRIVGSSKTAHDRIWNALKSNVTETAVEDTLMNARKVLLQHFDVDSNRRRLSSCSALWKMAPPGSGLAFHTWPVATLATTSCGTASFVEESWSCCLDEGSQNNAIECPSSITTSPRKSGSQSKSSGSSTHFEHGQKELVPTTSSSQSHCTTSVENDTGIKHQHEEESGISEELSSELSHSTKKCDGVAEGDGANPQASHSSSGMESAKANNIEKAVKDVGAGNNHSGTSRMEDSKTQRSEQVDTETVQNDARQQQPWNNEICLRYKSFEKSAAHMNKAMDAFTVAVSSQHLTSCAESLSASYLSMEEFTMSCQECEDDIARITTELESVLDMMFPARSGRKSNETLTFEKSGECQRKIEELMLSRKEAVAAKLALLLLPKR